ncbi:cyclopropane fatty-acyl-phospholipid synthase-like methyltransferase [Crossiella equi]|uniref:Cyclopropane fatty-acyl-phospholipid synthase-like methyltransferase n=1 Tax=Crossiella equi TaxID=130796 RepID=A0ABS5A5M6_9PSEU|nr:methyltransferase domain-containing protein [Crossiella equi]MBP2471905.1 cyclopropane fatty-acyl-phospholipid synthase-like methyltransferase [Crossiella equi]
MAETPAVVPVRVGLLYDRLAAIGQELFGASLHFGYWPASNGVPAPASLPEATRRLTGHLVDRLAVPPGSRVLDIGCGSGAAGVELATRRQVHVHGISVSATEVRQANDLARTTGQARFQFGTATAPAFADGTFDAAWALESLCHVPDRAAALTATARVLRPGARLLVTDFVTDTPHRAPHAIAPYAAPGTMAPLLTPAEYRNLLLSCGFAIRWHEDLTERVLPPTYAALTAALHARGADLRRRYGRDLVRCFERPNPATPRALAYHVFTVERRG